MSYAPAPPQPPPARPPEPLAAVPLEAAGVKPRRLVSVGRSFLLDEHTRADPTHGTIRVGPEELRQIADAANARSVETGDAVPLCLGHTRDNAPETEQPPVVGFAVDWLVEPFFDTGRRAVSADLLVYEDQLETVRGYPRRSVELWPGDAFEVDPVALLSSSTPERWLGLLRYSRPGRPVRYELTPPQKSEHMADEKDKGDPPEKKDDAPKADSPVKADADKDKDKPKDKGGDGGKGGSPLPPDLEAVVQRVLALFMQTDFVKQLEALAGHLGDEDFDDADPAGGPPPPGQPPPGQPPPGDLLSAPPPSPARDVRSENEPPPVKFGYAMPSGTNTHAPTMTKYDRDDDVKVRLTRAEADLARYQRENADLKRRVTEQAVQYRKDQARIKLDRLAAEGVLFDDAEQFGIMSEMDVAVQDVHADIMRRNFKTAPTAGPPAALRYARTGAEPTGPTSHDEARRLAEEALKAGKTYQQVLAEKFGKAK